MTILSSVGSMSRMEPETIATSNRLPIVARDIIGKEIEWLQRQAR